MNVFRKYTRIKTLNIFSVILSVTQCSRRSLSYVTCQWCKRSFANDQDDILFFFRSESFLISVYLRSFAEKSQQPTLGKRHHFIPHDKMIQHPDINQCQCFFQTLRYLLIRMAGLGDSRRMVMGKDDRRCIFL